MLIKILIYCGILFVFLRFLSLSVKYLTKKSRMFYKLKLYYPIFEIIIWVIVILLIFNILNTNNYFSAIVFSTIFLILILSLSWYFLRDLIAGIILKRQINFQSEKNLVIDNLEGKIIATDLFSIKFQTENSEIQTIFYNKLLNKTISETFVENSFYCENIIVVHKKYENFEKIKNQLFNFIKLSHLQIPTKNPEIELKNETNLTYEFEIKVFVLDKLHAKLIEEQIQKRLENV